VSIAEGIISVSYARISDGYEEFYQRTTRRNIPEDIILQKIN
jgi:hypothetical protein